MDLEAKIEHIKKVSVNKKFNIASFVKCCATTTALIGSVAALAYFFPEESVYNTFQVMVMDKSSTMAFSPVLALCLNLFFKPLMAGFAIRGLTHMPKHFNAPNEDDMNLVYEPMVEQLQNSYENNSTVKNLTELKILERLIALTDQQYSKDLKGVSSLFYDALGTLPIGDDIQALKANIAAHIVYRTSDKFSKYVYDNIASTSNSSQGEAEEKSYHIAQDAPYQFVLDYMSEFPEEQKKVMADVAEVFKQHHIGLARAFDMQLVRVEDLPICVKNSILLSPQDINLIKFVCLRAPNYFDEFVFNYLDSLNNYSKLPTKGEIVKDSHMQAHITRATSNIMITPKELAEQEGILQQLRELYKNNDRISKKLDSLVLNLPVSTLSQNSSAASESQIAKSAVRNQFRAEGMINYQGINFSGFTAEEIKIWESTIKEIKYLEEPEVLNSLSVENQTNLNNLKTKTLPEFLSLHDSFQDSLIGNPSAKQLMASALRQTLENCHQIAQQILADANNGLQNKIKVLRGFTESKKLTLTV